MSGTNVVPMAKTVPAPAAAPPSPYWPMPQVMPGCCPPGGMNNLMQCYCDVQSATAFICAVMVDCINTNPAVAEAMIAAIQKSGSNLPLLGVTNGSAAQPGQVGEFVLLQQSVTFTAAAQSQTLTMGVLQPGDWNVWQYAWFDQLFTSASLLLVPNNPGPPGFSFDLYCNIADSGAATAYTLVSPVAQASISVPTLIATQFDTNTAGGPGPGAGHAVVAFAARRMR